MPSITVDQWLLEYIRSDVTISAEYANKIYLYEVPAGIQQPYMWIQLVSGTRAAKTQVLRESGKTRFQIDVWRDDRYQARSEIELIIKKCIVHNLFDRGLRIEQVEVSGPRNLPAEEGYRFSCDVLVTWTQEEYV